MQTEFRKQIETELRRERDSQKEDLIQREGRFLLFSENTDEYAETDMQAEPAGNEQLEMPESRLVYLAQPEKQEEVPEEKLYETEKILRIERQKEIENVQRTGKQLELEKIRQSEKLRELEKIQQTEKNRTPEKTQQSEKLRELEKIHQTEKNRVTEKIQQLEKLHETEKLQQKENDSELEKRYQFGQQVGKLLEIERQRQPEKNSALENSAEVQPETSREIQWDKQLEQVPLPELPEARLIYRKMESQPDAVSMDRSSEPGQLFSQRDRLEQFLPVTAAGQAALIEQKIVNERTNVILKSLLSEKIWKSTESHAAAVAGQAEREAGIWKDSTPYENKTAKLTDRIQERQTSINRPENAAKFKTVTAQAENATKFRTIMSRSESTAGSQSGVNPMSGANPMLTVASRISESGGYPSNSGYSEILPGITRFRTRRGAPGTITEIRMISGIRPAVQILKTENDRSGVSQSFAGTDRLRSAQNFAGIDHLRAVQDLAGIHPLRVLHRFSDINPANSVRNMNGSDPEMIHIPDLAGAVKIQYADHGKHRQDQTASNSDVLAMSAKLTQTREETRILKRDSGFTRSTLIEQEKKINGLRQELREQMQTVNEEVKRLINTQKQDASVRNMADRVMKELQKQFRTEKIRRGY